MNTCPDEVARRAHHARLDDEIEGSVPRRVNHPIRRRTIDARHLELRIGKGGVAGADAREHVLHLRDARVASDHGLAVLEGTVPIGAPATRGLAC